MHLKNASIFTLLQILGHCAHITSPKHANLKLSHGPDNLHQPLTSTCGIKSLFVFQDKQRTA